MDIFRLIDHYDRRFARAMAAIPERTPWTAEGRSEIINAVRRCPGIRDEWVPEIRPRAVRTEERRGLAVELMQFESWPGTQGAAHLYIPPGKGPLPSDE